MLSNSSVSIVTLRNSPVSRAVTNKCWVVAHEGSPAHAEVAAQ